jgi:hypothetical protein
MKQNLYSEIQASLASPSNSTIDYWFSISSLSLGFVYRLFQQLAAIVQALLKQVGPRDIPRASFWIPNISN